MAIIDTEWILWGTNPAYADGVPIKLTGGSLRHCRREASWHRRNGGWQDLAIRAKGEPSGLAPATAADVSQ